MQLISVQISHFLKLRGFWKKIFVAVTTLFMVFPIAISGIVLGCVDTDAREHTSMKVTGLIQKVESNSILEISKLYIVDDDDGSWVFDGGSKIIQGFYPAHLRGHMLSGLPVTVTYYQEGNNLVIYHISD